MSQQVHILRLGPARLRGSYRDYKSGLYLTYPEKVEGTVPLRADLSALYTAVKMQQLIDVTGSVVVAYEASKQPKAPEQVVAAVQAAPAPAKPEEEPVVQAAPVVTEEQKTEDLFEDADASKTTKPPSSKRRSK